MPPRACPLRATVLSCRDASFGQGKALAAPPSPGANPREETIMHAPHVAEFEITPGFALATSGAVPQASRASLLTRTRCRVASPAPAARMDASDAPPTPSVGSMLRIRAA
jgi:hypothetical protein